MLTKCRRQRSHTCANSNVFSVVSSATAHVLLIVVTLVLCASPLQAFFESERTLAFGSSCCYAVCKCKLALTLALALAILWPRRVAVVGADYANANTIVVARALLVVAREFTFPVAKAVFLCFCALARLPGDSAATIMCWATATLPYFTNYQPCRGFYRNHYRHVAVQRNRLRRNIAEACTPLDYRLQDRLIDKMACAFQGAKLISLNNLFDASNAELARRLLLNSYTETIRQLSLLLVRRYMVLYDLTSVLYALRLSLPHQTFALYMNFYVCIMYVSCINTYRYIHEAMFKYMKNTWNFMYHVLTNLGIITNCIFNYIRIKIQKITSRRLT